MLTDLRYNINTFFETNGSVTILTQIVVIMFMAYEADKGYQFEINVVEDPVLIKASKL